MSAMDASHLLETKPVGKLLLQYSIPAIIGMTVTSLYNIIDSIFIGSWSGTACHLGVGNHFSVDEPDYRFLYPDWGRGSHDQFHIHGAEGHGEDFFGVGKRVFAVCYFRFLFWRYRDFIAGTHVAVLRGE